MRRLTAVVMPVLLAIGSFDSLAAQAKPAAVVGKIAVTAKGDVSFDGKPVTIDVLKERLADNRLPISMSTKPDFSDVLLPDGSTRPR